MDGAVRVAEPVPEAVALAVDPIPATDDLGVGRCGNSNRTRHTVQTKSVFDLPDGDGEAGGGVGGAECFSSPLRPALAEMDGLAARADAKSELMFGLAAIAGVTRATVTVSDVPCVEFTSTKSAV